MKCINTFLKNNIYLPNIVWSIQKTESKYNHKLLSTYDQMVLSWRLSKIPTTMANPSQILLILSSSYCVWGLPEYCYNYYSEFALDEHYNPSIYPEVNTTITDLTTLYKVSEVWTNNIIYFTVVILFKGFSW